MTQHQRSNLLPLPIGSHAEHYAQPGFTPPGSARIMIIAVTWLLATRGLEWVAFTGAATLINSFQRLGLIPTVFSNT